MQEKVNKIYNGNNLDVLKNFEDNSCDALISDFPYALSFMNAKWDTMPRLEMLKEFYRVLKAGAFLVTTFTPRLDLQSELCMLLKEAGFDVSFSPIYWAYKCLSEDSEVYTKQYGWINLLELQKRLDFLKTDTILPINNIEILVYDKDTGEYRWEVPCKWNVYYNTDTAYRIQSNDTDQIVSAGHNCLIEQNGKLLHRKAEELGGKRKVSYAVPYLDELPTLSSNIHSSKVYVCAEKEKVLHEGMQMQGSELCGFNQEKCTREGHCSKSLDGRRQTKSTRKDDGCEKSRLERWNNIFKKEGKLCFSINKICEMSARIYCNGKKRWLGCLTSFIGCNDNWETVNKDGVCASYQSQCGGQQNRKFNVIQEQQGTQTIRGRKKYNTTLATITPVEYNGMIYCPTTKAGSFVARRNGKIFITGNSGFPKASNFSKVIQKNQGVPMEFGEERGYGDNNTKRHGGGNNIHGGVGRPPEDSRKPSYITKPTTPEAIYCDGLYSLSVKPAVEPILICQKPHNKAKYKQALDWYYERKELLDKGIPEEELSLYTKNASGGVWIDDGRIPTSQEDVSAMVKKRDSFKNFLPVHYGNSKLNNMNATNTQGRFPANLLCGFPISKEELRSEYPEATEEELDKMVNMIENPLDVGRVSKSVANARHNRGDLNEIFKGTINTSYGHDDQGDLSRYFSLTAWSKKHFPNLHNIAEKTLQLQDDVKKTGDCLFVCKPSQAEKNAGLEGFEAKIVENIGQLSNSIRENGSVRTSPIKQNTHPTAKPIALYNYLTTLFSKDGDVILDPFCGSGTTLVSCVLTNRKYIGIEMSEEYHKIAEARTEHYKQQKEAVKIPSASKKNVSASKSIDTNQNSLF